MLLDFQREMRRMGISDLRTVTKKDIERYLDECDRKEGLRLERYLNRIDREEH